MNQILFFLILFLPLALYSESIEKKLTYSYERKSEPLTITEFIEICPQIGATGDTSIFLSTLEKKHSISKRDLMKKTCASATSTLRFNAAKSHIESIDCTGGGEYFHLKMVCSYTGSILSDSNVSIDKNSYKTGEIIRVSYQGGTNGLTYLCIESALSNSCIDHTQIEAFAKQGISYLKIPEQIIAKGEKFQIVLFSGKNSQQAKIRSKEFIVNKAK